MELKKNPKKDLNRNSGIFFAAGLFLVLMFTYVALEWKWFYNNLDYDISMYIDDEPIEDAIVLHIAPPQPPTPPITPPILEVILDEEDQEETIFDVIEPDQETEVVKLPDIEFEEVDEDLPISFIVVENVPVFPGCENDTDKRACFNKMMKKHIVKNFRYPELEQDLGIQGRVNIIFEIQKDGSIGNIRMRGPNKNLENDAARIIGKLPKMTPGKQRGNPVRVPFSIPITYKLSN